MPKQYGAQAPLDSERTFALHQLTAADVKIIEELTFLEDINQHRHPGKVPAIYPGQSYIARKCGLSREHVSRRLNVLHALGFLQKTRRRPVKGRWQTCMYRTLGVLRQFSQRLARALWPSFNRVMYPSHIATSSMNTSALQPLRGFIKAPSAPP